MCFMAKRQLLSVSMMPYIGQAILGDVDMCTVWLLNFAMRYFYYDHAKE